MAVRVASLEAVLDLNKDKFEGGLKSAGGQMSSFGKTVGNIAGGIGATALVGTTAAVTAVGAAAIGVSNDIDTALGELASQLGLTEAEAAAYERTMKGVFANNFGEDFGDIAETIATVERNLGKLSSNELQTVSEAAFGLRDAFGADVNETLDATRVLMEEFGLTSTQALDLVTKGLQDIPADDFLDSIREYGNQFGNAGFAADQFFSILATGTAGGVLGTDKIGDAVKEFGIRIQDSSSTTADALASIGINSEDLMAGISDGSVSAADAFDMVVEALQGIEDPLLQAQAGVGLFGTQWEDLGAQALLAVDSQQTAIEDMAGSTDTLNEQYDNLGSAIEGFQRRALVALDPIGDVLLDLVNQAMPFIDEFLDKAMPLLEQFAARLGGELPGAIAEIGEGLTKVAVAMGIADEGSSSLDASLALLGTTLDGIVNIINLIAAGVGKIGEAFEVAAGLKDLLGQIHELSGGNPLVTLGAGLTAGIRAPGNALGIPGFADGGVVPGPAGSPQMIMAHGGEVVLNEQQQGARGVTVIVQGNIMGDAHLQEVVGQAFGQLSRVLAGGT